MSSALEEAKPIEIDQWLTLETAPSPTKLKTGQTPNALNVWVDEKPGSVITANGFRKVGTLPSGQPGTFCINYFKTSAGTQTFVVSDNSTVWTTVDFQTFTAIITGLSSAFQLRGAVVRDKLWLTNGNDNVRTFDGTTVTVLDGSGSTPNVPKGRYIAYHDERVWIGHISSGRSQCYFSALTDASANVINPDNASAWPNTNFLQISEGDADFLTGLMLYRGYLHFFKQYTIWRLVGYDEYTYTRVKTRASTGTRFNESLQILDSLVHLIGIDGIYVFDGEETERISDIIDPATAEQTAFGFNQLQQPNQNNQFWEVSDTADFNAGTVPVNLTVNNEATLRAADDSQADFQAGVTQTNIDTTTTPGSIQLSAVASGGSSINSALGASASLVDSDSVARIGDSTQITDGVTSSQQIGYQNTSDNNTMTWVIDLGSAIVIGSATINQFQVTKVAPTLLAVSGMFIDYSSDNISWTNAGSFSFSNDQLPHDYSSSFSTHSARYWRFRVIANQNLNLFLSEIQLFRGGFQTSGQFVSRTLDLGDTPASVGNFFADYSANGETVTFQTQTSSDGSSWDAAIAVTNSSAIASTPKRYIRWIANFTSDGLNTPVINAVYVGSFYKSAIHDTGGNIFAWGAFEADFDLNGQTISFYYRGATTVGGVSSAAWNLINSGGALNLTTSMRYVQFKFEISGFTSGNNAPVVRSITLNWVQGSSANQTSVLQNVASYAWRNRYWLSAAGASATANDTILIRGKKTFGSPWQLKDWNILAFTRYLDNLYGTSSVDGSIYQLDTGYSKGGSSLDAIFETGDFSFKGFQFNVVEADIECERLGPYSLTVGFSTDQGQTWTDKTIDLTIVSGKSTTIWKKLNNLNFTTDKIRLRFYITDTDKPFQVHTAIIYCKVENQRGTLGTN